ncbi:putative membrane protein [Undibacterium sp. GrIS 1.8]|uniref:hypothetical protein n=1 Tax=unclassified Undibacterium TaxID=2630295 RepID=UPI0033948EE7
MKILLPYFLTLLGCVCSWQIGRIFRRNIRGIHYFFGFVALIIAPILAYFLVKLALLLIGIMHIPYAFEEGWQPIFIILTGMLFYWLFMIISASIKKKTDTEL